MSEPKQGADVVEGAAAAPVKKSSKKSSKKRTAEDDAPTAGQINVDPETLRSLGPKVADPKPTTESPPAGEQEVVQKKRASKKKAPPTDTAGSVNEGEPGKIKEERVRTAASAPTGDTEQTQEDIERRKRREAKAEKARQAAAAEAAMVPTGGPSVSNVPSQEDIEKQKRREAKAERARQSAAASDSASADPLGDEGERRKREVKSEKPKPNGPSAAALPKEDSSASEEAEKQRRREEKREKAKKAAAPGAAPEVPENAEEAELLRKQKEKQKQLAEEKRRRRELEKKAEEDAKRALVEKQKKELERQKRELNENAEECEEDEYGDDFEEFEEEESPPIVPVTSPTAASKKVVSVSSPVAATSKQALKVNQKEVDNVRDALLAENAAAKERKKAPPKEQTQVSPKSKAKPKAHTPSVSSSLQGLKQALDPRAIRVKKLLTAKKFEIETFCLYSQSILTPYELYSRTVRAGNLHQKVTQTKEDCRTISTQTEDIDCADKDMLFPDDIALSHSRRELGSAIRLENFLQKSASVCEIILEENLAENSTCDDKNIGKKEYKSFSKEILDYGDKYLRFIAGREIADICFSSQLPNLLLTAFGPSSEKGTPAQGKSILFLWDLRYLETPQKVLIAEGVASCCALNPERSQHAFLGTAEGTIECWDLRERISAYSKGGMPKFTFEPTYSTELNHAKDHESKIVSIGSLGRGQTGGRSSQMYSLDDRGIMVIWTIMELEKGDEAGLSEHGLDLRGKVRLMKTAVLDTLAARGDMFDIGSSVSTIKFFPDNPAHYIMGLTSGSCIVHGCRFGKLKGPRTFYCGGKDALPSTEITDIAFSPFFSKCFLASNNTGTISIFKVEFSHPILSWEISDCAILTVKWSKSRPGVFFALDEEGYLYTWSLVDDEHAPIMSEKIDGKKIALSPGFNTRNPMIAIGKTEKASPALLHILSNDLVESSKNEFANMQRFLSAY